MVKFLKSRGDLSFIYYWKLVTKPQFSDSVRGFLSRPNAAYMRRGLDHHWVDAKPLPEPMMDYCQLDSRKQISGTFESQFYQFFIQENWLVCHNGGHFVQGEMS